MICNLSWKAWYSNWYYVKKWFWHLIYVEVPTCDEISICDKIPTCAGHSSYYWYALNTFWIWTWVICRFITEFCYKSSCDIWLNYFNIDMHCSTKLIFLHYLFDSNHPSLSVRSSTRCPLLIHWLLCHAVNCIFNASTSCSNHVKTRNDAVTKSWIPLTALRYVGYHTNSHSLTLWPDHRG